MLGQGREFIVNRRVNIGRGEGVFLLRPGRFLGGNVSGSVNCLRHIPNGFRGFNGFGFLDGFLHRLGFRNGFPAGILLSGDLRRFRYGGVLRFRNGIFGGVLRLRRFRGGLIHRFLRRFRLGSLIRFLRRFRPAVLTDRGGGFTGARRLRGDRLHDGHVVDGVALHIVDQRLAHLGRVLPALGRVRVAGPQQNSGHFLVGGGGGAQGLARLLG